MEYTLRPAHRDDLEIILTWIDSPQALRLWGGPNLSYPPQVQKTWREIGAEEHNAYALVDAEGIIVGFGQLLVREVGQLHLGRIMVSPAKCGQGIGKILGQKLIEVGCSQFQCSEYTLNVYQDNLAAVRLYKSLGFQVIVEYPEQRSYRMLLELP